jgi:NitT/TauT family transport system substrate-binding protein
MRNPTRCVSQVLARAELRVLVTAAAVVLGASHAPAQEKVRVGWVPAMVSAPIMIAREKGYFKAAGLDIELESVTTATDAMAHVGTNRMQVLEGGVQANFFNAVAARYPIVIAGDRASTPLGHLVMIRPDLKDEIRSLKDLKGRTISVAGAGSIIAYEMDKLLQTVGLSLKDTNVKVLPVPQLPVAFANKVIDAADIYAPMTHQLEQQKLAVRLVDPDDILTNMVVAVSIINTDWAREKPGVVRAFFAALLRGTRDYCQAYHGGPGRAEIVDIIMRTGIENRPEILALAWPSRRATGRVDPAAILDVLDWYRANGFVKGEVPRDRLVDNSFVEAANATMEPFRIENSASKAPGCR